MNLIDTALAYLKYRLKAKTKYSIHSPFLFDLVNEVFNDHRVYYAFDEIEAIRKYLLKDQKTIEMEDYGAGSKILHTTIRGICDIVKTSALPPKYGRLLFRLVNYFQPKTILELGTGAGIGTMYMGMAAREKKIITLDGSMALSEVAQRNFDYLHLNHIEVITGKFGRTLSRAFSKLNQIEFLFIDGDHRKSALVDYFEQCLPRLKEDAIMVIDDINWSNEMNKGWQMLTQNEQVTLSLDLFRMGILFFRQGIKKQHLKLLY